MGKIMTLEVLSSIKGAKASDAVDELFGHVKKALSGENVPDTTMVFSENEIRLDELRDDIVIESTEPERKLIMENFPAEKKGYLLVQKVIED
jgi:Asp-tRNA(Asn)/Glu-tRNA(Gln) amidotransferase C subunit